MGMVGMVTLFSSTHPNMHCEIRVKLQNIPTMVTVPTLVHGSLRDLVYPLHPHFPHASPARATRLEIRKANHDHDHRE